MDVLSVDVLKMLPWILALLIGAAVYFIYFRKWYSAAIGAAFTFVVAALGIGMYILLHATDTRWSGQEVIQAPKVSETPLIGQSLEPLGTFLNQTANSINYAAAFQHAFPVAWEFFMLALYGLIPLAISLAIAGVMSHLRTLLLEKKVDLLTKAVNEQRLKDGLPPVK
jgi:hypothetical protein